MASTGQANDFQAFIHNARERKKNEDLASKLLSSKSRRQSAPNLKAQAGGSLASRQRSSLAGGNPSAPGNVNGEWTHDLHSSVSGGGGGGKRTTSLGARITTPGSAAAPKNAYGNNIKHNSRGNSRSNNRAAAAFDRMAVDQLNIRPSASGAAAPSSSSSASGRGISIRGLAGPFVVMAQNFAPGTTAADVESAMTPVGGEMESCRITKTSPFMVVEMVFHSREGGERVIQTFNDKMADGRLIKVYPKIGNQRSAPTAPAAHITGNIIDGVRG
ncbi:hypothetical protein GMORB2_6807 [Geosmithia morbida]|uniref:RNA-binding protein n=1 Tax=Geosmithia morbida TaxID=1094350 RepID=A0A9P5D1Y5_9HYPO|nr:uncharacterized protein GMORB2_6807 [Geosmithia morbida]KAF4123257.1 hypothetical protein GMORB2_6807 [Geosmithia morbida]